MVTIIIHSARSGLIRIRSSEELRFEVTAGGLLFYQLDRYEFSS